MGPAASFSGVRCALERQACIGFRMTYFGFLLRFLFIPVVLLLVWAWRDARRGRQVAPVWRSWSAVSALLLHVLIAVLYTTPWDNYLVATRVWWYDPALVTGIVIGWVPIEEYTFFIMQPILAGVWLLTLLRYERSKLGKWEIGGWRSETVNDTLRPSLLTLRPGAVGITAVCGRVDARRGLGNNGTGQEVEAGR